MDIGKGFNLKDPLPKAGSLGQRDLFDKMNNLASKGYSADQVIGATLNLLCNAMRQTYSNRTVAEARYNELMGNTKEFLLKHYDSVTGKRLSNFAHTQHIHAMLVENDDVIKRPGG